MKIKLLAIALCVGLLSSCASQTFTINGKYGEVPTSQKSQTFFLGGLGQEQVTNAAAVCAGAENVIKVEAQHTLVNGLLAVITLGIYTPRDAKVYCKRS